MPSWEWQVLEQRHDGFKLKFIGWGGTSRISLMGSGWPNQSLQRTGGAFRRSVAQRRLQGRSVLRYLHEVLVAHRNGLPSPSLLAAE